MPNTRSQLFSIINNGTVFAIVHQQGENEYSKTWKAYYSLLRALARGQSLRCTKYQKQSVLSQHCERQRNILSTRLGIEQGVRGPPEDREAAEEVSEWRSPRREQGRFRHSGHWPGPEAAAWEPIRVTFPCHEDVPIREAPRLPQAVLAAGEHDVFSGVQSQAAGEKKGRLCSVPVPFSVKYIRSI